MTEHIPLKTEGLAYEIVQAKLGDQGMAMLGAQLEIWHELNTTELDSSLRDAFSNGDTRLPEGTLLHSASMHSSFDRRALEGIAELGIVSGELIGKVEDAETHGCVDFFRVPLDSNIADYMAWAKESVTKGNLRTQRGERLLTRGITFVVDPSVKGMSTLLEHDGYRDESMHSFVKPPTDRSSEETAAVLGGVPRGSIAGIIVSDRIKKDHDAMSTIQELFPVIPVFDQRGENARTPIHAPVST